MFASATEGTAAPIAMLREEEVMLDRIRTCVAEQ
jgi:hypothetical protein